MEHEVKTKQPILKLETFSNKKRTYLDLDIEMKYVSKIYALNFEIVAVTRQYIRFFSFRKRFKALRE